MPKLKEIKTKLLFWDDPYQRSFQAEILEITRKGIVLNQTIFYPAGGGQPSDEGWVMTKNDDQNKEKFEVIAVEKKNGKIIHHLKKENLQKLKEGMKVQGEINWEKRYQLMKGHTSQHILSAKIIELTDIKTEKAVMSEEAVSIYLEKEIPYEDLLKAFIQTNNCLLQDKELITALYSPSKMPQKMKEQIRGTIDPTLKELRVVSIEGVDYSLCGGTHCKRTGEVGIIALTSTQGDNFHYCFGKKAIEQLVKENFDIVIAARLFAAQPRDALDRIMKFHQKYQQLEEQLKETTTLLVERLLKEKRSKPDEIDSMKVLFAKLPFAPREIVLEQLGDLPGNWLAILVIQGPILLVLSSVETIPANRLITEFCKQTENRGGGSEKIAQSSLKDIEKTREKILTIIKKIVEK
jgi:alanyl-tRNA synthetase